MVNSGRSSIGSPVLLAGTSAGHSPHTSQHMRNPSAEPGNSHTNGSSTSGYSRISVSGVSVAGIVCSVSFVQEKGAYSTLRIVYSKVRDGWKYVSVASGENSTLTMNRYRLDRGPRVGPSPSPSPISASSRPSSTFGIPGLGHERVTFETG